MWSYLLRELDFTYGITMHKLGELTGIHSGGLYRGKAGTKGIGPKTIRRIAEGLTEKHPDAANFVRAEYNRSQVI